jgi:hypothetical protein
VAELTIGLMIALAHRIPQADQYVRLGKWPPATCRSVPNSPARPRAFSASAASARNRHPADNFTIVVTLTASNMKGKRQHALTLPTQTVTVRVADLVDTIMRNYLAAFPLQERFGKAMGERDEDWLQYLEAEALNRAAIVSSLTKKSPPCQLERASEVSRIGGTGRV